MRLRKYTKFGFIYIEDDEEQETQWRTVRVMGIEYVFAVLCLIAEVMIYNLPVKDSIDRAKYEYFIEKLRDLEK